MSHPLILALFRDRSSTAVAARAVRALGIDAGSLSILARSHEDEGEIAEAGGGTPGVEIEDSRPAARLGELSGFILAAIASVMPGIGPIVTAGPLAAELGEAAGHVAGSVSSMLTRAGLSPAHASEWQARIEAGEVLLGVHVRTSSEEAVCAVLQSHGAEKVARAQWHNGE